jgi:hypothetical protein
MNIRTAHRIIDKVPDDRLLAFVRWCQLNDPPFVDNPQLVRGVMAAYMAGPEREEDPQ